MKTAPKGYPKDHPHIDLLKNKSFTVSCQFTDAEVNDKNFVKRLVVISKSIKQLNDYLNEAIS